MRARRNPFEGGSFELVRFLSVGGRGSGLSSYLFGKTKQRRRRDWDDKERERGMMGGGG